MSKPWELPEYNDLIANEIFSLGQINPAAYPDKLSWHKALEHERQVKDYIYKLRREDAEKNKYMCERHGIKKYYDGYTPLNWDMAQAEAIAKYGRPNCQYMYSPFDTENIENYYFDFEFADIWVKWLEDYGIHTDGSLANELILLSLEQRAFYRNLFGWKRKSDGIRRYIEVFKYIPRKNSKTFDLALLALGTMILDGEGGAKIVVVANSESQAHLTFDPALNIINKDKYLDICGGDLSNYFYGVQNAITANHKTDSFKPIAFNEKTTHGGNFLLSILDECHEMINDGMYEICLTSQGSRLQPMIIMITTAAAAGENFCNRKLDIAKKVCQGKIKDDRFLPILFYADPEEFHDCWHDINVHKRVNPMYGLAKTVDYMSRMHKKACDEPLFTNKFLRLDLNWITAGDLTAFSPLNWSRCTKIYKPDQYKKILTQEVPKFLLKKSCYAGLDLASKNDLCALTLYWPDSKFVLSWSFTAKNNKNIRNRERFLDRLIFCGDDQIDFKDLRDLILSILCNFKITELGFDAKFATQLIQELEENKITCVEVPQTPKVMTEPLQKAIDDVSAEKIKHNGCSLLAWQMGNCFVKEYGDETMIIKKAGKSSPDKIDSASAWLNACALALSDNEKDRLKKRKLREGGFFT